MVLRQVLKGAFFDCGNGFGEFADLAEVDDDRASLIRPCTEG
jgi:hypothetical protein